ncbi:MAG: hypothetical protein MR209_00805 [Veillonellaceae bacterium]|nr:hypothetical protein [Veillonellaceae bacterium]
MISDNLTSAYASLQESLTTLIGEPWTDIFWRSIWGPEPLHYFYYRPRCGAGILYWTDLVERGKAAEDMWAEMDACAAAAKRVWKAWIDDNAGRAPWTVATLHYRPNGLVCAAFDHRHRQQMEPITEQFVWEQAQWGRVVLPYRLARLRRAGRSAWRRPKRRRNPWRIRETGYWEILPAQLAVYRGSGLRRIRLPRPAESPVPATVVDEEENA